MRRRKMVLIVPIICALLAGCSGIFDLSQIYKSADNPLSGKDTDERVIMSLEKNYPEHKFSVVESFDKTKDRGIFEDEDGLEFEVHDLLYDNTYHFGCKDDYLAVILREQNFVERALDIASKCGYLFEYDEENEIISVSPADEKKYAHDFDQYAELVSEILNTFDVPEVLFPKEQGFSTGEVNYFSSPCMGTLLCEINYEKCSTWVRFYFEDRELTGEEIKARFAKEFERIKKESRDWS